MSRGEALMALFAFTLLLVVPVYAVCFTSYAGCIVRDPDVWWHLRTGQYIVEHRDVPAVDEFSRQGYGTPWVDYSWLAQVILYELHETFGLRGLVIFSAVLLLLIELVFLAMLRGMQTSLIPVTVMTLAWMVGMLCVSTPRPWLFSILFFNIELYLLLRAGQTRNPRLLLWLLPLFLIWANLHIQFITGLLVLAMAAAEPLVARWVPASMADEESRAIPAAWLLLIFVLSAAATLVNPYFWRLYPTAVQLNGQSALWNIIEELRAPPFRDITDWVMLAATMAGAAVLAARRPVRLLLLLLFPLAVYCSFRSRRDIWFALTIGILLVASASRSLRLPQSLLPVRVRAATAVAVLALLIGSLCMVRPAWLEEHVAEHYPVAAVEFLRKLNPPGPLFNTTDWGGYLIFAWPEQRVSIDGRTIIYGDEQILRHVKTIRGGPKWQSDPDLAAARVVIVGREEPIASLLRLDKTFSLAYEDSLAVVFFRP
jgi:hypothetical protein